jgi:hypothetical protein
MRWQKANIRVYLGSDVHVRSRAGEGGYTTLLCHLGHELTVKKTHLDNPLFPRV